MTYFMEFTSFSQDCKKSEGKLSITIPPETFAFDLDLKTPSIKDDSFLEACQDPKCPTFFSNWSKILSLKQLRPVCKTPVTSFLCGGDRIQTCVALGHKANLELAAFIHSATPPLGPKRKGRRAINSVHFLVSQSNQLNTNMSNFRQNVKGKIKKIGASFGQEDNADRGDCQGEKDGRVCRNTVRHQMAWSA